MFLNKSERPIPFRIKLLYFQEEFKDEGFFVAGNLDLQHSKLTSLPDNLIVLGHLRLEYSKISKFPLNLNVGGWINLFETPLERNFHPEELISMLKINGGIGAILSRRKYVNKKRPWDPNRKKFV
jgi:hypothetical protein